ncbi:MAG: SRPBCC family protein [Actinomycetota bacterium]|nr:SRPBCC family protein [Actinomycetota bacterium]
MRVERSVTIHRPVDRVFEYASTPGNDPTWVVASLRHEVLSPGPLRLGSITEEDVGFMGRRMRYVWEVVRYEPPTAFALRSVSGPLPATIRLRLEPLDGGTTNLTLVGDVQLRGVYRLAAPLMRRVARRQLRTQLGTLKALLENEASEGC